MFLRTTATDAVRYLLKVSLAVWHHIENAFVVDALVLHGTFHRVLAGCEASQRDVS